MNEVKEVNINIPKRAVIVNKYAGNPGGWLWFLGFIGAIVYYWQMANGFGEYVVGFLKAFVWPAYLVYHLLKFLGL
jgi:hypothetical protein